MAYGALNAPQALRYNRSHWLASRLHTLITADGLSLYDHVQKTPGALSTPASFSVGYTPILGRTAVMTKDTASHHVAFAGRQAAATNTYTVFAIIQPTSAPSANEYCIFADSSGNSGWRFTLDTTTLIPRMTANAVANLTSPGISITSGEPWFVAYTINSAGYICGIRNLSTGAYSEASVASTATSNVGDRTYKVGGFNTFSRSFGGHIALVGCAYAYIGIGGIRQLANDPWGIVAAPMVKPYLSGFGVSAAFLARQGLNIPQAVNRASTF